MYKDLLITLGLLAAVTLEVLATDCSGMPVTRNLDSVNHPVTTFAQYQQSHPIRPTVWQELGRVDYLDPALPHRTERTMLIVVEQGISLSVSAALTRYQQDLLADQLSSILVDFNGTSVEDLRDIILDYDASETLTGVFLIGDLPTAWFELYDDFDNNGQPDGDEISQFPCDLFFADLDGLWADLDENGIYDFHGGGMEPDIWVGRVKADNLDWAMLPEITLINRYFERNHLFRRGLLENGAGALAYVDDDWEYWGEYYADALAQGWSEVELIRDINATNAWDYREERLPEFYDYIQVMVHSGPDAHYFYWNNHQDYELVHNYELHDINPNARFYNLFACSNAHFETDSNMGCLYLLDNEYCLISVGSTKTGSMLSFEDYYTPLGADSSFGAAMQHWWSENVDNEEGDNLISWQRSWFYGVVTLGDPALKTSYELYAPGGLELSLSSDSVFLSWNEDPSVSSWQVYSADTPYGPFQLDETGQFNGADWQAPRTVENRYYHVTALFR